MPVTDSDKNLPAVKDQSPEHKKPKLLPLWILTIIALLLVISLACWNAWQWHQRQSLGQTIDQLRETTAEVKIQQNQMSNGATRSIQALQQEVSNLQKNLSEQQRQVDYTAQALLDAGHRNRTDWLLAEAEYLLRIGNQRLQIEKDISGSLAALQSADEVLAESDDVGAFAVRAKLANEIMSLKSLTKVDQTGLFLKIQAAIESLAAIEQDAMITRMKAEDAADAEQKANTSLWRKVWNQIKSAVSSAVAIRRLDEPVSPLLSPDQTAYLRLNVQLMLEQAGLAVLRRNQELYDTSLAQAADAVGRWYDQDDAKVDALADTIAELRERDIAPELPDISQSLDLLKARLDGRIEGGKASSGNSGSGKSGQSQGGAS